jgi:hypothetical protein
VADSVRWVGVKAVAVVLDVDVETVRRMVRGKRVRARPLPGGRCWRIAVGDDGWPLS